MAAAAVGLGGHLPMVPEEGPAARAEAVAAWASKPAIVSAPASARMLWCFMTCTSCGVEWGLARVLMLAP